MMMGPEVYYSRKLKGKSVDEIMKCIRSLKKTIKQLKDEMEHPDYQKDLIVHPSERVQLSSIRLYLERAKQALVEAGGEYKPTKAELIAQDFQNNIPYINKIVFRIGGYFEEQELRTYILEDENVRLYMEHSLRYKPGDDKEERECDLTKADLLEGIEELYIGEWLHNYDPSRFGYFVLDGTQWELEIYFSNGHRAVKKYGSNSYPYNFSAFCDLIGYEFVEDIDIEEE